MENLPKIFRILDIYLAIIPRKKAQQAGLKTLNGVPLGIRTLDPLITICYHISFLSNISTYYLFYVGQHILSTI